MKSISVAHGLTADHSSSSYAFMAVDRTLEPAEIKAVRSLCRSCYPDARMVRFAFPASEDAIVELQSFEFSGLDQMGINIYPEGNRPLWRLFAKSIMDTTPTWWSKMKNESKSQTPGVITCTMCWSRYAAN